jgi:hypothetical protein
MRKAVTLQQVIDDLYTHNILKYKLDEIYTVRATIEYLPFLSSYKNIRKVS